MQIYELWLDESGDFEMESQASKRKNPSLVGGILIPKNALSDHQIRQLADPDKKKNIHAMEMDYETARRVVPPALEGICKAGGKLVYFENSERIDYHSNRDLYLRVLSSGLAQLVKMLASQGQFKLSIIVASRSVPNGNNKTTLITPEEYRAELKSYIADEFTDINFSLDPSCQIALTVLGAKEEYRLALADYACNARFVINSEKYRPVRSRLLPLFESRYHFTVTALTSESIIRAKLSLGDVSGALVEYFTTRGKISKTKMFSEIMTRLSNLSYRLQRLQIRKFSSELRNYVAKETDFERSEALLESVIKNFFALLPKYNIDAQSDESLFWIELSLADMYLREGDVIRAAPVMQKLEEIIKTMNYRVENLAQLYFYRDKKALFEINCMEYSAAVNTMSKTIKTMEDLISVLSADELVSDYLGTDVNLASEYLGDAYCMKIYAELFLQRTDRALYDNSLRFDSDRALSMYYYPGELERNQQYRSKAENEEGRCFEALKWLLKTKNISIYEDNIVKPCIEYLSSSENEDSLSRCYYIMYFVEIMENASRLNQDEISDAMKTALDREKHMLSEFLIPREKQQIPSDVGREHVVFDDIFSDDTIRRYHPMEIVLWKYGSFLYRKKSIKAAKEAWDTAIDICDENPDYTVLKMVATAIQLERLALASSSDRDRKHLENDIIRRCESVMKIHNLPNNMKEYAESVLTALNMDLNSEKIYSLSRIIAF